MITRLRQSQLTLLGELDAAKITLTFHVHDGVLDRDWWISAVDEDDQQVLLWSDRTPPGPRGGLNLAELLSELLEITRLLRAASHAPG